MFSSSLSETDFASFVLSPFLHLYNTPTITLHLPTIPANRTTLYLPQRTRLSTESSIERILRQRTLSLFFSRCPSFHPAADVPAEPPLPRVRGDEEEERERERRRGRDERGRVRWT